MDNARETDPIARVRKQQTFSMDPQLGTGAATRSQLSGRDKGAVSAPCRWRQRNSPGSRSAGEPGPGVLLPLLAFCLPSPERAAAGQLRHAVMFRLRSHQRLQKITYPLLQRGSKQNGSVNPYLPASWPFQLLKQEFSSGRALGTPHWTSAVPLGRDMNAVLHRRAPCCLAPAPRLPRLACSLHQLIHGSLRKRLSSSWDEPFQVRHSLENLVLVMFSCGRRSKPSSSVRSAGTELLPASPTHVGGLNHPFWEFLTRKHPGSSFTSYLSRLGQEQSKPFGATRHIRTAVRELHVLCSIHRLSQCPSRRFSRLQLLSVPVAERCKQHHL